MTTPNKETKESDSNSITTPTLACTVPSQPSNAQLSMTPNWLTCRSYTRLYELPLSCWLDTNWLDNQGFTLIPALKDLLAVNPSMAPTVSGDVSLDFMNITPTLGVVSVPRFNLPHPRILPEKQFLVDTKSRHPLQGKSFVCICSILGLQPWLRFMLNDYGTMENGLRIWFTAFFQSLTPGGHFFLAEGNNAPISLFGCMKLLESIGFIDIDVAYAAQGIWYLGARKPEQPQQLPQPSQNANVNQLYQSSPMPSLSTSTALPAMTSFQPVLPTSTALSPPMASSTNSTRTTAVPTASTYLMTPVPEPSSVAPSTTATTSSTSSGPLPQGLLIKLPLLFARFDPQQSGLLSYAALQALCRQVGRVIPEDDDSDVWWTYQSVAAPDKETGQVGISIEDLSEHFYKTRMWDLEHDLKKLKLI